MTDFFEDVVIPLTAIAGIIVIILIAVYYLNDTSEVTIKFETPEICYTTHSSIVTAGKTTVTSTNKHFFSSDICSKIWEMK